MTSPRATAAQVIFSVAHEGNHLDDALVRFLPDAPLEAHGFIKAMCFGVMRIYPRLLFFLGKLLDKPVRNREKLVECLLLAGLYECYYMQTPSHACVSETVNAVLELKKKWARGMVNSILRNALRERASLEKLAAANEGARLAHPKWLIKLFRQHWPDQLADIIQANNEPGPFTLRVNLQKTTRDAYQASLQKHDISASPCPFSPAGLQCNNPLDVSELPDFAAGLVSVQDQAAQLAAGLIAPQKGQRILDACAAPGGKTAHLLESFSNIDVTAIDISEYRLQKITDNLERLGLSAQVSQGDARKPDDWWDGKPFDRILLDAPCSATGVIRRHPDIKLLRHSDDILKLVKKQQEMLLALWPLLKPGGMLLYATCSILKQENEQQIQQVSKSVDDITIESIEADWGIERPFGRQILPGQNGMDGFYYALLRKTG